MDLNILNYLRLVPLDMVLVLISTCLIVVIAKKYFWVHVKNYIDNREKYINDQLSEASLKLQAQQKHEKQAKEELLAIRKQANSILQEARDVAIKEAEDIKTQASNEANGIKEKAKKDIENQKLQVMQEMKNEMSEIAMLTASKIVKKELDDQLQKEYVNDFIEEVSDATWQA
ncbi:MAG: F0F1 ATP synthase subunit B [Erysipelotrichaceae bacterium]